MLDSNKVKLAIAPIGWTNDDMPDLGAENTFEQCISEMALAGFKGTVIKSSAGAAERLPVARVANIGETIRRLKEQGVFVYCADMDGVSLRKNNLTGPIALVLGSEGSGVSQLVKKLCDGVVRLDMAAPGTGVDSYNVSVAAGIILYEIQSQRAVEE